MNDWASLLPFVLIVLVFWFLVVRPARRQQQKLAATQSAVQVGSEVMLGSGIYGTVLSVGDETLQLQVAPGTTMKVARQAVVKVVEHEASAPHAESARNDDTPTDPQD
ncbi:MAG: preprotein translocase subunit YajC [Nocardioides sp.]